MKNNINYKSYERLTFEDARVMIKMLHIMKLKEKYFDYIKYGTKEYELRLNDEKRKFIKKGDFIEFQKEPLLQDKIIVMVDKVLLYNNFKEIISNIKIELLANSSIKKEEFQLDLEEFYSNEKQNEYGVVAIKLNKNIIINSTNINNIPASDKIFSILKNNYINFNEWFNKIKLDCTNALYTENDNKLTSILILKYNEIDSQQFKEKGNILKIRTLLVIQKGKGIGKIYLKLIDDIARKNKINYIYLTIKINNNELINYMEKNGYKKYNKYNDEFVYYKEVL